MSCSDACHRPQGLRQAHCSACHRTFTGVTAFDEHRFGGGCRIRPGVVERGGLWATEQAHEQRARAAYQTRAFNLGRES